MTLPAEAVWVHERQRRWDHRCNVCRSVPVPGPCQTRDQAEPAPGVCPWCGHPASPYEAAVILTDLLDHQHPKGPPR